MATVALIQRLFRVLTYQPGADLHGLEQQIYDNFFEALEEAYNHTVQTAKSLEEYLTAHHPAPDVVICAPLAEEGNPAPGLAEIRRFRSTFPNTPLIVWSTRQEKSLRDTCLKDLGCAAYYTGTLLAAPDELPALIAEVLT
ncbi:MAG: hypothetical protein JW910_12460 [Anaerolineae bacterium]|nr:hypothetical protein [Anaerolineae bacterium]